MRIVLRNDWVDEMWYLFIFFVLAEFNNKINVKYRFYII